MRYKWIPKELIEETRRLIRFSLFLRFDCGLKGADRIPANELKKLLRLIKRDII